MAIWYYNNGGDWKARKIKKQGRGSQTPGLKKSIRPSALQRIMCRRARSYKYPNYAAVMATLGSRKKVG